MFQTPATFRIVTAVASVAIGAMLVLAKVYFSAQHSRPTMPSEIMVLPVTEVVGERAVSSLAAAAGDRRVN
jgi:hypothetical protein